MRDFTNSSVLLFGLSILTNACGIYETSQKSRLRDTEAAATRVLTVCEDPTATAAEKEALTWLQTAANTTSCSMLNFKTEYGLSIDLIAGAYEDKQDLALQWLANYYRGSETFTAERLQSLLITFAQAGDREGFYFAQNIKPSLKEGLNYTVDGRSIFQNAIKGGSVELVQDLIKIPNLDINKLSFGCSALHEALSNSHITVAETLLNESRFDPVATDLNCYDTYYSAAISTGNPEVLRVVTRVPAIDVNGHTERYIPLHSVIMEKQLDLLNVLLESPRLDLSRLSAYKDSPLGLAVVHADIPLVKRLMQDKRTDLNLRFGYDGRTALLQAAISGRDAMVDLLLEDPRVDAKVQASQGRGLLHMAAAGGLTERVLGLVRGGADINARDSYGWTPILLAAESQKIDTVRTLMKQEGIDLNARDSESGRTILHWAAYHGNLDLVTAIIEQDLVNPTLLDKKGQDARFIAYFRGFYEVEAVIQKRLDQPKFGLNGAMESGIACVENYLSDYKEQLMESGNASWTEVPSCNPETYKTICVSKVLKQYSQAQQGRVTWYREGECPEDSQAFASILDAQQFMKTQLGLN